jgi:signal peptidase II
MRVARRTAVAIFAIDQATKIAVVDWMNLRMLGEIDVWPPFLNFRMAWNRGINFGLFAGQADAVRWLLVAVALVVSVAIWVVARRMAAAFTEAGESSAARRIELAAGLGIGGALGNVVDRVLRPEAAVADFLNMSCCGIVNPYSFNVADIAIFAGVAGLVIFGGEPKRAGG